MPAPRKTRSTKAIATADEIADRRARVIEMHYRGGTIRQIGEALGIPKSTVSDDIAAVIRSRTWEETKYLQRAAQGRYEHEYSETMRLFNIAAYGVTENGKQTIAPNHDRANRLMQTILQIEERRARLEGTDAPTLSRVTMITDEDLAAAVEERRRQLRLVNPEHPLLHRPTPALGTGSQS
jgi:hypothetical protein